VKTRSASLLTGVTDWTLSWILIKVRVAVLQRRRRQWQEFHENRPCEIHTSVRKWIYSRIFSHAMVSFVKIRKWKFQHTAAWNLWVSWKSVGVKATLYFEDSVKFWPSFLHSSANLHEVWHKRCLKKRILWCSVSVKPAHSLRYFTYLLTYLLHGAESFLRS